MSAAPGQGAGHGPGLTAACLRMLLCCPPPCCCRAVHGLHTPRFTLDEGVLKLGAALHTALATEFLEQRRQQGGGKGSKEEL